MDVTADMAGTVDMGKITTQKTELPVSTGRPMSKKHLEQMHGHKRAQGHDKHPLHGPGWRSDGRLYGVRTKRNES